MRAPRAGGRLGRRPLVGFGTGGWQAFEDTVAPLAERYGVNVGSDRAAARDALVLDRATGSAYFVPHEDAERFLTRVAATQ